LDLTHFVSTKIWEITMNFRKKIMLPFLATAIFVTSSAQATLLSDLILTDGSIQVGDKLFSNWLIDSNVIENGILGRTGVNLANIDVTGDASDIWNPSLTFTSLDNELSITQLAGLGASLNLAFQFDVTVLDPTMFWHDISLTANFIPGSSPGVNNRTAHIHEFLYDDSTLTGLPFAALDSHLTIDGVGTIDDSGIVFYQTFGPRKSGTVLKDIDFSTEIAGEIVGMRSFTQTFSQVPEPSSVALFGLALMGLASRRFKKQT
jgi:hypothetical protein